MGETGARALDSHDILASCPKISWECKHSLEVLMDKYYPIEVDPFMSTEEKIPHMLEWYSLVNNLLGSQNLTQEDVEVAVRKCKDFRLRSGVEELFGIAHRCNIPIIIISAGLGNIIEEVVRQHICLPAGAEEHWHNVRVLSNTLLWDSNGAGIKFSEPLLHMFNKSLRDAPDDVHKLLEGRRTGILCGDGLGDLSMADGHETTTLLKFGFLNEKVEERFKQYSHEDAYDQILLQDGSFEPVLEVLRQL